MKVIFFFYNGNIYQGCEVSYTDTAIIAGAKTIPGSFIKKLFEIAAKYCKIDEYPYL